CRSKARRVRNSQISSLRGARSATKQSPPRGREQSEARLLRFARNDLLGFVRNNGFHSLRAKAAEEHAVGIWFTLQNAPHREATALSSVRQPALRRCTIHMRT